MTDDLKAAPHPAATHPVTPKPTVAKTPAKGLAKKAAPKPRSLPPAIPSVTVPLAPVPQSKGAVAGAVAVTLGAGVLIGHAISRMLLRR